MVARNIVIAYSYVHLVFLNPNPNRYRLARMQIVPTILWSKIDL